MAGSAPSGARDDGGEQNLDKASLGQRLKGECGVRASKLQRQCVIDNFGFASQGLQRRLQGVRHAMRALRRVAKPVRSVWWISDCLMSVCIHLSTIARPEVCELLERVCVITHEYMARCFLRVNYLSLTNTVCGIHASCPSLLY